MKNAKNIQKITTSLFLAATLVLGSVSFAVPGIMPSAFAATENLYVSADNNLFGKSFNGPMVIEVVVNDNDIDDLGGASSEPDVTVNGATLKMIQAGDGNWYAYIAEKTMAENATTLFINDKTTSVTSTDPFGDENTDADAVYDNASIIVRQSKDADSYTSSLEWPVIQAFDFAVDGDVTISYAKGGNPQSLTLKFLNDPDDYASLSLDRSSYPAGAGVHMTITSLAHNIDPTDEDSWTYETTNGTAVYQQFSENGAELTGVSFTLDELSDLTFDDSGILKIDTNPNNATNPILKFVNNDDQVPVNVDTTSHVTILETQPNSGIFKNTDDGDKANIEIASDAPRGYTAVIDFADSPLSVPVRNYPGSLVMDVNGIGGTWNGGEEITVTLDDGDLNLNSLVDEDFSLTNWAQKIPTVITGSPLTLMDAVNNITSTNGNNVTITIDTFSKRALIIGTPNDVVNATFTVKNIHEDLFYFSNTLDDGLKQITFNVTAGGTTQNVNVTVGTIPADGNLVAVADIFTFGQIASQLESAATTRNADAIYRMLLEETGDNTAMYTGSIEYTALNQLNVGKSATYDGLATIDDEITIIVPTDLTDEDAVRVDYLDTDGEGVATQIGDQVDAPTHSGIVSFDGSNYKVADTVTVTLTDADLNTDSDTTEVYTLAADTEYGDRIGEKGTEVSQSGRLLDITFDDATWTNMGCGVSDDGLSSTGFTLSETTSTSGIFTGTFQIPANYCTSNVTVSRNADGSGSKFSDSPIASVESSESHSIRLSGYDSVSSLSKSKSGSIKVRIMSPPMM